MDHRLIWAVFLAKFRKINSLISITKSKFILQDFEFPLHAKSPKSQINHMYIDNS